MLEILVKQYRRERFHPTFLSMFINPSYLIRKGLMNGIKRNADHMNGVMLDFGCGEKPYREFFNVEKYIGLDVAKSGHDHTRETIDVFYDGTTIPFESEYFDSALSSEVFEHIFNINEILREIHRVMKTGGKLLITVPFVWDEHETPYDFFRYTSFGIKRLLEEHGFEVISLEKNLTYVETLFQLWIAYFYKTVLPSNKYLKFMLAPFLIFPLALAGILISKVFPRSYDLYSNNIVVARKKAAS